MGTIARAEQSQLLTTYSIISEGVVFCGLTLDSAQGCRKIQGLKSRVAKARFQADIACPSQVSSAV
jgi:hypothetical protein